MEPPTLLAQASTGNNTQAQAVKVPLIILHGVMDGQLWGVWELSDLARTMGPHQYASGRDPTFMSEILTLGQIGNSANLGRAYDFAVARDFHETPSSDVALGGEGAGALMTHVQRQHGYRIAMPAQTLAGTWDWWGRNGDDRNGEPPRPDAANAPDAFVMPYDWRRSNDRNARHLAASLRMLRAHLPLRAQGLRFVMVCHSMGGLVARLAIEQHGAHQDVAALITLGTPHHGSMKLACGLLGFQMQSLNLAGMDPRVWRSAIPRLAGPMELMPEFMFDAFAHMEQVVNAPIAANAPWHGPAGFYSPHNRPDRHVPKLTKENFLFRFPECQELMGALRGAIPGARSVIQKLNGGGPPAGVRYYCLGVANRYTPYAVDWRGITRRLEQRSADYYAEFDREWARDRWDGVRTTLSNIVSTQGAIRAGNAYPGLNYRVYLDVGSAANHPQDPVGGDDTVPVASALALQIEGFRERVTIDMDGPATTADGGLVDDGHSHMCVEPQLRAWLRRWLTLENVRQGCRMPNEDTDAANAERRQMGAG